MKRQKLVFSALIVMLAVVGAEYGIRALNISGTQVNIIHHGVLMKHRPHTGYWKRSENLNWVRYNNLGFHDRDREAEIPKVRFLFLGDSFVEGAHVPADLTFTALLEKQIQEKYPDLEIINGGVSGTNTAYQYLLWKEFFRNEIRTDRVFLIFYLGDDLAQNIRGLEEKVLKRPTRHFAVYLDRDGQIYVNGGDYSWPQRAVKALTYHSALLNFIYTRLYERKTRSQFNSMAPSSVIRDHEILPKKSIGKLWEEGIRGTLSLIEKWHKELAQDKIRFSVAIIPSGKNSQSESYGNPQTDFFVDQLEKFCSVREIPFLRLDFRGIDPLKLYSFDGKTLGHFSYEGHKKAAEQLLPWVERQVR